MNADVSESLQRFFERYRSRSYAKGQILIHAHDAPEYIYQLQNGTVKQYDISPRGDEVVLNVFKPPAFFPMSYAINKTENKYFFEADSPVEARLVPMDEAVAFVKNNPAVMFDLLARVYRGTDGILGRMAHLMASTARHRVMYELLVESRRLGERQGDQVAIDLNESDIGARAGLTRETVNRELHKLKGEGLIIVNNGQIVIHDFPRLSQSISREL